MQDVAFKNTNFFIFWITARRIFVTSSDELELDAQIFLQNNRTNVYINQYIWYNIYMGASCEISIVDFP